MDVCKCSHTNDLMVDCLTVKKRKIFPRRADGSVLQDLKCQMASWMSHGSGRLLYQT